MAPVYLARDLKHDRPVALKVLHVFAALVPAVTCLLLSSCSGRSQPAVAPARPTDRSGPPSARTYILRDTVRPDAPDQLWGPPPPQLRQDLYGRDFLYYVHGSDRSGDGADTAGTWTVESGQVKKFAELRRFRDIRTATGDMADEIHVIVTLAGRDETIRGPLVLHYKRLGKRWRLSSVEPRDGDRRHAFTFERIRNSDGAVIAEMSPAPPRPDPTPFTPRPEPWIKPLGVDSAVIQAE